MAKYIFKNPEVEKALRLVAKELGVSDEEFDKSVDFWGNCSTIFVGKDEYGNSQFSFRGSLLKEVKDFDPYGWNDADVLPPENPDLKWCSVNLIIEDAFGLLHFGFYHFDSRRWRDVRAGIDITCKRYRLYPAD